MRRVFQAAVVAAVAAAAMVATTAGVQAQQVSRTGKQVTLVLRNGQRHTGMLVYHNNNNLNLVSGGENKAYSMDDVIVVEFVAGAPSGDELAKLPPGSPSKDVEKHMLALKNGTVVHGRMYTITPTAITMNTPRGHQDYPLNEIARWYVIPAQARQAYGK
jgi:hypothetical protein